MRKARTQGRRGRRTSARTLGALVALMTVAAASEREARACGGCIPPPTEIESIITDEKMILSISKDQTTLFDEIRYSGSPSSFAWVLPIRGTATVGLSADVMFTGKANAERLNRLSHRTDCVGPPGKSLLR